uniref:Uncharacterized protein n=1 Tax=Bionectria ochroleuca TaxID=29856 RepID=A0A0B7JJK7_BIOOC
MRMALPWTLTTEVTRQITQGLGPYWSLFMLLSSSQGSLPRWKTGGLMI